MTKEEQIHYNRNKNLTAIITEYANVFKIISDYNNISFTLLSIFLPLTSGILALVATAKISYIEATGAAIFGISIMILWFLYMNRIRVHIRLLMRRADELEKELGFYIFRSSELALLLATKNPKIVWLSDEKLLREEIEKSINKWLNLWFDYGEKEYAVKVLIDRIKYIQKIGKFSQLRTRTIYRLIVLLYVISWIFVIFSKI